MTVVVTGVGMITPLGQGVTATWDALLRSRSGVAPIRRFDPTGFPVRFAAETPNLNLGKRPDLSPFSMKLLHTLKGKLTYLGVKEALEMAKLQLSGPRLGICIGSEAARPELEILASRMQKSQLPTETDLRLMAPQAPAHLIQELTGATGPLTVVSTACTSSSQAVGEGMLRIRRGEVDAMIVGGVDVLVDPLMVTGFSLLGALSTRNDAPERASRPFELNRDGFVLGEGSGFLILEDEVHASRRGAEILGRLSGFGCSCNAYRITDSPPDGRGAAQSMRSALKDARLAPSDIGYINAHGTSTKMNDTSETRGILHAFSSQGTSIPVSSTKSMTGHLVAACGAVEAIFSLLAVRNGTLPPTINLDEVDPECGLNHVANIAASSDIQHAMTNAFGFGGSNGTLVVSRC